MNRVDLDAIERRNQTARELLNGSVPAAAIGALVESQADVPAIVAELRAAREVIEAAQGIRRGAFASRNFERAVEVPVALTIPLGVALDAYEKAVGS